MTFSRRSTEYVFGIILKLSVFSIVAHLLNLAIYSFIFSGRKDIELNWRVDIEERDSYDEFLQVIDYYVKKHRIKIFFKDSEFNSDKELKEIPKKLFFLN